MPLRYYDFWNQRIEICKVGMFLGPSELSPKIWENFQNGITQKRLDAPLKIIFFGFSASRSIWQAYFYVDQRCHPKSMKILKTVFITQKQLNPVNIAHAGPNGALHGQAQVTCMGRSWQTPAAGRRVKHRAE